MSNRAKVSNWLGLIEQSGSSEVISPPLLPQFPDSDTIYMPELPDLQVLVKKLGPSLEGRLIAGARVHEPIVLRLLEAGDFGELIAGQRILSLERHGPFLHFGLERHELVMHLMLAGRLRLAPIWEKKLAHEAFAIDFAPASSEKASEGGEAEGESGDCLSYGDEKNMGKVYLCPKGDFSAIPGYKTQGLDILSPAFTWERFARLIEKKRNQARAFIMDQTMLSAIGNAYADEILFEAGIHPKTPCCYLTASDRHKLYDAINTVIAWGIAEVEKADRPIEEKVRGHLRVRNRGGEACPRCGTTIRKAGVLGFDAFFCPKCQPDRTGRGLDWSKLPGPSSPGGSRQDTVGQDTVGQGADAGGEGTGGAPMKSGGSA